MQSNFTKSNKKMLFTIFMRSVLAVVSLLLAYLFLSLFGLKEANSLLLQNQFTRAEKGVSNELVIIAVDDESLAYLNSWPWPRGVYANVLKQLELHNVRRVAFDIDFSSSSNFKQDVLFSQSLDDAKFDIALGAYVSKHPETGGFREHNPIPLFAEHAVAANANIELNSLGRVEQYYGLFNNKQQTLAAFLANLEEERESPYFIDYSYPWQNIPMYSVKDLLTEDIPTGSLQNKDILIGSTAIVLGDNFNTLSGNAIPGVYLHGLAYETIIKEQQFTKLSLKFIDFLSIFVVVFIALVFNTQKTMRLFVVTLAGYSAIFYTVAYLHVHEYVIFEAAKLLVSLVSSSVVFFCYAFYLKTTSFYKEKNKKNYHKAISSKIIKGNVNAIFVVDIAGNIIISNEKAKKMFRLNDNDSNLFIFFEYAKEFIQKYDAGDKEQLNYHKLHHCTEDTYLDLEVFVNKVSFVTSRYQGIIEEKHELYSFIIIDETEKIKALEDMNQSRIELLDIKFNDPVAKISNRFSFENYLTSFIEEGNRHSTTVILLRLNSLQEINYIYGRLTGNSVLYHTAQLLVSEAAGRAKVFKFSSATFALVYTNQNEPTVEREMQRLYFLFTNPLQIQNQNLLVSVSLGSSLSPMHGSEPLQIISYAEASLDYAHTNRFINYFFYDEQTLMKSKQRVTLKQELYRAINQREFVLFYQPQLCLQSDRVIGLEGLLRWKDPIKGLRYPNEFIGALEDFGFMGEMGQLIIDMGCEDATKLPDHIKIAINVSPVQFLESDLEQLCITSLEKSGLEPSRLELEITESMLMDDIENVSRVLHKIKKLGITIAMDDFGTGYSSLQYLSQLPFDKLKVDRSFSKNLLSNSQAKDIMVSIIQLGKAASKTILVEGIENQETAIFLAANGCDFVQGYFYGKPKPISEYLS